MSFKEAEQYFEYADAGSVTWCAWRSRLDEVKHLIRTGALDKH